MKIALSFVIFAALCCPLFAATVNVNSVATLTSAINNGSPGDVILIAAGTYTIGGANSIGGNPAVSIHITKSYTIKAASGPGTVTINGNNAYICIQIEASNVTLDGLNITNVQWGVSAQSNASPPLTLTGNIFRNLTVTTLNSGGGHGISLGYMTNSIIELCTVSLGYNHGISLYQANNNLIVNNTIVSTGTGDGIALVDSDRNTITGNTIGAGGTINFDGVAIQGSQYNYIGYNNISNVHNGVTLTNDPNAFNTTGNSRGAIRNWVGNNHMVLRDAGGSDPIWFNYTSDYSMAFGNDGTGAAENGLALYTSRGDYVVGNVFFANPQGGIFVTSSGGGPVANHNSIQQNYLYNHQSNGGVTLNGSSNDDVGFNFIATNPANTTPPIGGFVFQGGSSGGRFYSNTLANLNLGENVTAGVTTTSLSTNRHFNTLNHASTSAISWDSGSNVLGGNYYSDFTPNGNPSNGSTPYTNISGGNKDNYPYQSENLGKNYGMIVQTPAAGSFLAAGTTKTISWIDQGCVYVDLAYTTGSTSTPIVSNYADFGFYKWTVPAATPGAYTVTVTCKNSANANTGTSGNSPSFNITTGDLVLLSPQRSLMVDSGAALQVSWKKSTNVGAGVDVYIRYSDAAAYTLLQAGVTNDFLNIVPPSPQPSNRVSVKIVNGSFADSTDGWFSMRTSAPGTFTSPVTANGNLYVGTPYLLEWVSPAGTDYVNIDLVGGANKNIVTGVADFGRYLALIPDNQGSAIQFKLTFFNNAGANLGTANSVGSTVVPGGGFSFGGGSCNITVAQTSAGISGSAGTLNINVNGGSCGWGASSNVSWLTPVFASGSGGTVSFNVSANGTNALRSGTVTISGQTVTVYQAAAYAGGFPSLTSLNPFQGTGPNATLTLVYSDPYGWAGIQSAEFIVNPRWEPNTRPGGCYVKYAPGANLFTLIADDGVSVGGTATPGANTSIANSQCTLNAATSSATGNGNTLTLVVALTFSASFSGQRHIWMQASDYNGLSTNWLVYGVWFPTATTQTTGPWYRIYDPNSKSYLYSADQNEYNSLGAAGFVLQGISGLIMGIPGSVTGVSNLAFYRVFVDATSSHFWTSDRNEFLTLINAQNAYVGEGVATFIMPYINAQGQVSTQVTNSIPFYRAAFQGANLHFWTSDPNEYFSLNGKQLPAGYVGEGIASYVFPASGAQLSDAPVTTQAEIAAAEVDDGTPAVVSVSNGASRARSGVVSPGQVLTVLGRHLGGKVLINGGAAKVIDSRGNQLQVLAPDDLPAGEVTVEVEHMGRRTRPMKLTAVAADPAIFVDNVWGRGNAQAHNEDGSSNGKDNAAARGSVVTLYATGFAHSGKEPIEVHIGGRPAEVVSAHLSGARPGVIEVRVRVPEAVEPAAFQPVVLHVGELFSQPGVSLAIR